MPRLRRATLSWAWALWLPLLAGCHEFLINMTVDSTAPVLKKTVTPGWMVSVCPAATVTLPVTLYGPFAAVHVPETLPAAIVVPPLVRL